MKVGNLKIYIFLFVLLFAKISPVVAADRIESVPLVNLEELSPTFEEDKDALENTEEQNVNQDDITNTDEENITKKKDTIYINIRALDKITAKTSEIKLTIGEKKFFGTLEIKGLKCQLSEHNEFTDIVAYLQVKDRASKDNNQVFLFNGWTFVSSPTLQSIDHPIYDLWITGCENI